MYLDQRFYKTLPIALIMGALMIITPFAIMARHASKNYSYFLKKQQAHYTTKEIADLLGWMKKNLPLTPTRQNYCGGLYKNGPILRLSDKFLYANSESLLHIKANQTVIQPRRGYSYLKGAVRLYQSSRALQSDEAVIVRDQNTHKIKRIQLKGHVRMVLPGRLIVADQAEVKPEFSTIWHMLYRLLQVGRKDFMGLSGRDGNRLDVWGQAQEGRIDHQGILHLKKATYSTCPPGEQTWHLRAARADLNPKKGRGQAYNVTLLVHHTPVFYLPFVDFPLDGRRKSGFLLPSIVHSDKGGFELRFPFYWNIAPNTDLTLTPHYIEHRGSMFDVVWRYLFPSHQGKLHLMLLPDDRVFRSFRSQALNDFSSDSDAALGLSRLRKAKAIRGGLSFTHTMQKDPHWSSRVNINLVSDDYLLFDLNTFLNAEEFFHLRNSADIHYATRHWEVSGLVLAYQTLHPVNQNFVDDLYTQTPRLNAIGYYSFFHSAANVEVNSEWVHFDHTSRSLTGEPVPTGHRFNLQPSLNLPMVWASGFIRPRLEVLATYYLLNNPPVPNRNKISRVLPLVSLDAGAYWDRYFEKSGFGSPLRQTLEPRLFYLMVPLHNQDDIPLFDTDVLPFSFDQLFRAQRFVGVDRLGDANQISAGLTSRLLRSDTGEELFRMSLGATYYFHRHRVCLTPDCLRDPTIKNTFSPIVGELRYHLGHRWQIVSGLAWNPSRRRTDNGYLHVLYRGPHQRTLYLTYRYIQNGQQSRDIPGLVGSQTNNLGRVSLALSWPITRHWSLLLSSSYNSAEGREQAYYYGLQYNSCCWAIRFLSHNVFNAKRPNRSDEFQHRYYLQVQLKGLSNIGNNDPGRLLEETIPGYRNIFK